MRKKIIAIAAISAATVFGRTVAAGSDDYPPGGGTTTVAPGPGPGGGLPETGSDSNDTLQIAGGVVLAGAGLAAVGWYRRKPGTAPQRHNA